MSGIERGLGAWAAAALLAATATAAAAEAESSDDEKLLQELMQVVEQGTEIATRTRMNVDYVPGMATILEADLLQSMGARTVLDAMAQVPGVLAYRNNSGAPVLLVRGVGFPFNTGNVKVLVNGLSMSGESSGISNSVLLMPLSQVERVEFVRGPGSTLYGDFAFMGLLNIITRKDSNEVYLRAERGPTYTAGGNTHWQSADGLSRFWLNAAALTSERAERPNAVAADDEHQSAMLGLEHGEFGLGIQTVRRELAPPGATRSTQRNDVYSLSFAPKFSEHLQGELQTHWLETDFADVATRYRGDLADAAAELRWTGWRDHSVIARLTGARERVDDALQNRVAPPGAPPIVNVPVTDVSRSYWGIGLQDQWTLSPALSLTAGLRYDRRDDLDRDHFTPRLGLVWRAGEAHILKAQYSEGYRAPTFFELYAPAGRQDHLDVESVGTSELSYIYRAPQQVGRVTIFHSRLRDMIYLNGPNFGNRAAARAIGAEAEWQQQLSAQWRWEANLSQVDSYTTRTTTGAETADPVSADWLGNLALLYRPSRHWVFSTQYTYVSERNNRPATGEEHRLALAATMSDLPIRGLKLRLFGRNVLERDEYTVSALPTGVVNASRLDDAQVGGEIAYEF